MPTLTAIKRFRFAGKLLAPGDRFECNPYNARVLTALGRAAIEPPKPVQPAPQVDICSPPADPEPSLLPPEDDPTQQDKPKRQYKRRDMAAE